MSERIVDTDTAVVMAGGYGRRMLPLTTSIDKCMIGLPRRQSNGELEAAPVIDFVVADLAVAGIKHVVFVTGKGPSQIRDYYGGNKDLEEYLFKAGKHKDLDRVRNTGHGLSFDYVEQDHERDGSGTAVPLHLAAPKLDTSRPFMVAMGDTVIHRPQGGSEAADALAFYQDLGVDHLNFATKIPREQSKSYGILERDANGYVRGIIEKPDPDEAPVDCFANAGQYVFAPRMLGHLSTYMAAGLRPGQDEYYLTDLLGMAAENGEKTAVWPVADGTFLDAGTPDNWAETFAILAK